MADAILRPNATSQLILRDEGGAAAITIQSDGDVEITEDIIIGDGKL